MKSWTRGANMPLSEYFSTKEFECKDGICSQQRLDEILLSKLNQLRALYNGPIVVTSGFRCMKHQADLKKQGYETAAGISSHNLGQAADVRGSDMARLLQCVDQIFDNVGVAKTFIHVDVRPLTNGVKRRWSYTS